jgi:YjbE family integral membrane protein
VLSGDNALVIGAAAARLPRRQQRGAIIWGGVGAVIFRIALASTATLLFGIPLVQAIGGVAILIIAIRLLMPDDPRGGRQRRRSTSDRMMAAIVTIVVADVSMSLDNVLAVGALAAGNLSLLAAGLVLSMVLLMTASAVVASLIRRFWWLMDVAAIVLGWTAAGLIANDIWLNERLHPTAEQISLVYVVCVGIVLAADLGLRLTRRRTRPGGAEATATTTDDESAAALSRGSTPRHPPRRSSED